ncbi:transcriptional regulator TrmB [Solihabitans fulvus]|uniref:Transcriptional regulator TrmB n=1 Tax=Solihabitans fulvus TaxID=1892852 RepID=A0A5B2WUI7_9PSEU|nr:helix-turn-helix domain-containing protein [Solihabitans fulvus]KAA2254658.1 transcriptional regulator TrmB [Solihabitans fulvus]
MLDVIGLDPTEQALYEHLVSASPCTHDEIASALAINNGRLSVVLDRLMARGLVSRVPGSPVRWATTTPNVALEVLFLEQEERIRRGRLFAEQLTAIYHQASATGDPATLVEVISGPAAIAQHFEQIQRSATREIRAIDKPPYAAGPLANHPVELEMLRRGISYRVIYDPSGLERFHDLPTELEISLAHGEQARVLPDAPIKLCVADDRLGLIPLQAAPPAIESIIVVHRSALLDALCALFDTLWDQAMPLPLNSVADSPAGPTLEERRLLALLTTGMPDESIAKQMGLSHRTFQRRLHALLARVGAKTRFQAGLRAAHLGWVTPRP